MFGQAALEAYEPNDFVKSYGIVVISDVRGMRDEADPWLDISQD